MKVAITVSSVSFATDVSEDGHVWVRADVVPVAGDSFGVFADASNIGSLRSLKQGSQLLVSIVGDKKRAGEVKVYTAGARGKSVEGKTLDAAIAAMAAQPPRAKKPSASAPAAAPISE